MVVPEILHKKNLKKSWELPEQEQGEKSGGALLRPFNVIWRHLRPCLLYTPDAADDGEGAGDRDRL